MIYVYSLKLGLRKILLHMSWVFTDMKYSNEYNRNPQTSSLSKGGGVLIVIQNVFISQSILFHNVKIKLLIVNI